MKPFIYTMFAAVLVVFAPLVSAVEPEQPAITEADEGSTSPSGVSGLPVSSRAARQELQSLLDQGLKMLASELVAAGTFYPFVAMLGHDNEVRLIGTPATLRVSNPDQAVQALVEKTRVLAGERRIRAAAFFMDYVATRQDTGFSQAGIRVELNHIHPDALSVFIPYSITDDKKLRLLTPQYKKGKNLVFDPQP